MKTKLKDIMESLGTIFFVIMFVAIVLLVAITILVGLFLDELQKTLNKVFNGDNTIPPAKHRPSILYMLEEGFFEIQLFVNKEGKDIWTIKHYHGNNELYIDKQPNKPFIIGYKDDIRSRVVIPDTYITKLNHYD